MLALQEMSIKSRNESEEVRQGDSLSGSLFNLVLEIIM